MIQKHLLALSHQPKIKEHYISLSLNLLTVTGLVQSRYKQCKQLLETAKYDALDLCSTPQAKL